MKTTEKPLSPHLCFLFAGLSPSAAKNAAAQLPPPVSVAKGDAISFADHGGRALGILLSGSVCVRRAGADGKEQNCNRLFKDEAFGAATLFGDTVPVSRVIAEKDCVVQFVPEKTLLQLMQAEPVIAENTVRFFADRIRFLNRSLNGLRGGSAAERLLTFLQARATNNTVTLPSMAAVATALDMGRTSLYRALDELEQAGALTRNGKTIALSRLNNR